MENAPNETVASPSGSPCISAFNAPFGWCLLSLFFGLVHLCLHYVQTLLRCVKQSNRMRVRRVRRVGRVSWMSDWKSDRKSWMSVRKSEWKGWTSQRLAAAIATIHWTWPSAEAGVWNLHHEYEYTRMVLYLIALYSISLYSISLYSFASFVTLRTIASTIDRLPSSSTVYRTWASQHQHQHLRPR